jgi:hypothetical protein
MVAALLRLLMVKDSRGIRKSPPSEDQTLVEPLVERVVLLGAQVRTVVDLPAAALAYVVEQMPHGPEHERVRLGNERPDPLRIATVAAAVLPRQL